MTVLKYVLIVILAVVSVISSVDPNKKRLGLVKAIKKWWKKKPYKADRFYYLLFLVVAMVFVTVIDDVASEKDRKLLTAQIAEQTQKIDLQSESLKIQERMLADQSAALSAQSSVLEGQQKMMLEQSKSVGSVLFNTDTSVEGKERFLQSFQDFARVSLVEAHNTGFEGLVCDDGVALFWFDVETETITGFHFFTKSEINRILCGSLTRRGFVAATSQIEIGDDSELAIAFRECLFRRLPPSLDCPGEDEQAHRQILGEVRTILRYVYRAEDIEFKPIYAKGGDKSMPPKPLSDFSVQFRYIVNPNATIKRYNGVGSFDIILSKAFIDSLRGLTIAEFSEKVIANFRNSKLDPKVRIKDLRILEESRRSNAWKSSSPFVSHDSRDCR